MPRRRRSTTLGIVAALRLAGTRAWLAVLAAGVTPDVVLLDGSHNWLSPETQPSLFDDGPAEPGCDAPVHTLVKADMQCLSVAAASILAKVERDGMMRGLHSEYPAYRLGREQGLRHRDAQGRAPRRRAHAVPPRELAAARRLRTAATAAPRPTRAPRDGPWRAGGARWCKMEP